MIFELGRRVGVSRPDCEDILQDAVVVLWKRVNINNYRLEAKISTFIYGVSKRMFINKSRKLKIYSPIDGDDLEKEYGEEIQIDESLFEDRRTTIMNLLEKLGSRCKSLIIDFYLGFSMAELANKHGYTTPANATNQRYKCMQRLKSKVEQLKKHTRE